MMIEGGTSWEQLLKDFQTLVAAFIALGAAGIAFWIGHLNRKHDQTMRIQDTKLSAVGVARALHGEILSQQIEELMRWRNALPHPVVFESMAERIGLLDSESIEAVSTYYGQYYEFIEFIRSASKRFNSPDDYIYEDGFLELVHALASSGDTATQALRAFQDEVGVIGPVGAQKRK